MLTLTGPPKINGLLLPRPSMNKAMEVSWSGEHIDERLRGGIVKRLETRWRGRAVFGWNALEPAMAQAILQELRRSPEFDLVPRTRAAGDPEWAEEVTLRCRISSPTPGSTSPASKMTSVLIECETVDTYPDLPGILEGSFVLASDEGTAVRVATTGSATWQGGTQTLTLLGRTYTVPTRRPWPPPVSALRVRNGSAPHRKAFTLDTD